jgi:hypothetical protein
MIPSHFPHKDNCGLRPGQVTPFSSFGPSGCFPIHSQQRRWAGCRNRVSKMAVAHLYYFRDVGPEAELDHNLPKK